MPGDCLGAGAQRHAPRNPSSVFLVGDRPAIAVEIGLARPPPGGIPFGDDTVHSVRRQEAVIDPLPQAVFVNRIAEIAVGVTVVLAQRRCRHAELISRLKIFQDNAPCALVSRAAAMTFIDDNQVEEIRRVGS